MGVSASGGECILFSDADLSTPIEEVEKLLPHLRESYDIAIGSRALNESQLLIHQPWYREMMGKTFNLLVQMLVMRGLRDTQCGFKIFKAETAREVFGKARINRFAFDVELLFIARKLGMRIKDVPVVWMHSRHSKVHILRDSLHMLTDLFRIKFYCLIGCYGKRFSVGERG
jgi:dolichyl-phosphate beta-glucosyltransferase